MEYSFSKYFTCASIILFIVLFTACKQPETDQKRPNILLAIADDASWESFSPYGNEWIKTPGIDKVAKEGILFNRAYTPNAKCAPSRACILTGLNSWQLGDAVNHWCYFPTEFTTYMEVLGKNGYHVGYTGKGWAPGVALDTNGVPRQLTGPNYSQLTCKPLTSEMSDIDYSSNFEKFLSDRDDSKPFCFWYGAIEPHRFYEYGSGNKVGGKQPQDVKNIPDFFPDSDTIRHDLLDYAFEIEYFDSQLQEMLRLLEEKDELDNTIVIVTADNGMPFPRIKGTLYEYSTHLPLAIMWPDGIENPGRAVDDYVNFIDIAPTILEAAGIEDDSSGMQKTQGKSLFDIFKSNKAGKVTADRDYVLFGKERHDVGRPKDQGYPIRGILKDDYLYLKNYHPERWPAGNPETGYLNCDGGPAKTYILNTRRVKNDWSYWQMNFGKKPTEELYHVIDDPYCLVNLADSVVFTSLKHQLSTEMHKKLQEQNDPRILGYGDSFDSIAWANDIRNFYERYMKGEELPTEWVFESDYESEWIENTKLIEHAEKLVK